MTWRECLLPIFKFSWVCSMTLRPAMQNGLNNFFMEFAKHLGAHDPGSFRPVVVFGIVYRTWGAIRSHQLLAQLAPVLPDEQLGFLPGREPLELWLGMQSQVEEALLLAQDVQGLSTDIVRAFNCIPREHSKALALHIGVPSRVVEPWMRFLAGCRRAFSVDGFLSEFIGSSQGMPEGCALSVFSMVQLDWAFHLYMRWFCPQVSCFSFVDNLVLKSSKVSSLLAGWAALQTFFELWSMKTDQKKTYSWALSAESRSALQLLDVAVVTKATELGGGMHFSGRRSTVHFQDRVATLEEKWLRLQHSMAPIALKQRALYTVFWPKVFHGINASPLSGNNFNSLRTRALKSLRLSKAGTNPLIRLSLSENCKCDPGYYYVHRLLLDFARLCGKDRSFSRRWHDVMACFNGTAQSGPYATLTYAVNALGWRVEPPFLIDHDGIPHNLEQVDFRLLDRCLHEGWLQHVSQVAKKRHMMADLVGLDLALAPLSIKDHSALDLARLRALQAGTFLDAAFQAKYDLGKRSLCQFCSQLDTHVHWLSCPGYSSYRSEPWPDDLDSWPLSLRAHLLPSRNPHTHDIKMYLHTLHTAQVVFHSVPVSGPQHVFTDGALRRHQDPWLCLASWGVINASSGQPIASGPLPGILQEIDTAEVYAVWVALSWAARWRCVIHLWIDSKFVADSVHRLLHRRWIPQGWANQSLWRKILDLLDDLEELAPCVHWIPSHVPGLLLRDPFEEWWATWNQRADVLATQANGERGTTFKELHDAACEHFATQQSRLQTLQAFYLSVAASPPMADEAIVVDEFDAEPVSDTQLVPLPDQLGLTWRSCLYSEPASKRVDLDFCASLLQCFLDWQTDTAIVATVSLIELVFLLLQADVSFPFWDATHGWHLKHVQLCFERPTLASLLAVVRSSVRWCIDRLALSPLVGGLDRSLLGIMFPVEGITLCLKPEQLLGSHGRLKAFCSKRPLRKACDLARPV